MQVQWSRVIEEKELERSIKSRGHSPKSGAKIGESLMNIVPDQKGRKREIFVN